MELGLSLGERASRQSFGLMEKAKVIANKGSLEFFMGLSVANNPTSRKYKRKQQQEQEEDGHDDDDDDDTEEEDRESRSKEKTIKKIFLDYHQQQNNIFSKDSTLIQLDLLPNTPVPRHNHLALLSPSSYNGSRASSFDMDFGIYSNSGQRASSRASDEDSSRKKLRLSKQQSAFLEESFKQHNTLNPKEKLALAKQLNLRPRQVEVWFQNRRARTKLKQTEVEFEYLKRCRERLTQDNTRLHKELQQLRALKSSNPFNIQLPPTTLNMCPSCEHFTTTAPANPTTTNNSIEQVTTSQATDFDLSLTKGLVS